MSIYPQGWVDMGGLPTQMAEYNTMDADGNAVDLSQRKTSFTADGTTKPSKAVLTPLEADSYKLDYMLRGTDEWDADWQGFILPAPQISNSDALVSWYDPTGFAVCYLVTVNGQAFLTDQTSCEYTPNAYVTVQAVSAYGVTGEVASVGHSTGVRPLFSEGQETVVRRQYFTPDGRETHRLQHGLTVIREILADGTFRTVKVVAK